VEGDARACIIRDNGLSGKNRRAGVKVNSDRHDSPLNDFIDADISLGVIVKHDVSGAALCVDFIGSAGRIGKGVIKLQAEGIIVNTVDWFIDRLVVKVFTIVEFSECE
jgi:hypothetical protein